MSMNVTLFIIFGLAIFTIGLIGLFSNKRRYPRRRLRHGRLLFWVEGKQMVKAILKPGTGTVGTLSFLDNSDPPQPAQPASPPSWSTSANGVVTMTVAADGMSAEFHFLAPGDVTVDVVAEGDPSAGVDTVHLQGEIQCMAGEIATGELAFSTPA